VELKISNGKSTDARHGGRVFKAGDDFLHWQAFAYRSEMSPHAVGMIHTVHDMLNCRSSFINHVICICMKLLVLSDCNCTNF